MHCKEIAQLLSEYVDGALPAGQVEQLEQHLADCEQCRQALADLRETLALVRELDEVAPPDDLLERIHARIEAEATPATPAPARGRRLWYVLSTPQFRLAAAASLLALIGVHALRRSGTGPETFAPRTVPAVAPTDNEAAMPAPELQESLSEAPEIDALPAPVTATRKVAKSIAPKRRESKAEADGAIWGRAEDADTAKATSASREVSSTVSAPPPPARTLPSLPVEGRAGEAQEVVVAERASRRVADVEKGDLAQRVETITVASTDPAAVMQQVARFTQEQEEQKRARANEMGLVGAAKSAARKLRVSEHGGTVVHARVPAARYEELVAALQALEQTPADEETQTIVTVIITIVQP